MCVAVIIPWRESDSYRRAALDHVRCRLAYDNRDVLLGECPPGPWVKSHAIAQAVRRTDADVLVLHDADVFTSGLDDAIAAVQAGAPWAVPHMTVRRLTEEETARVIAGNEPRRHVGIERSYRGVQGGGIVVIRRDVYEEAPIDPRFIGWGQEDLAAAVAWTTLVGKPWRGRTDLWHLWHPPQPRLSPAVGSRSSQLLLLRYRAAYGDAVTMRELIAEGRVYDTVDPNIADQEHTS